METRDRESLGLDDKLFFNALKASPIGIALEDLEGRLLFVNPALCSMLGFSEEELLNKHCVDFSPAEDAEKGLALFQQLRAGSIDHYSLDKRYFRQDGSRVWGRLTISLLKDRVPPLALAMVEDITEKKIAEDREHSLLQTLDLITKQMAAAVSRCSRDLGYLWVNQAYANWVRHPLNEVVGRPIADVLGKEAFEALLPHFTRVLSGEKVHYEQETNFQSIGRRWTSATYTPTLDANGTASGWVAVVLDITERKRAEQKLHQMNRALEAQRTVLQTREELLKIFVKYVPAGVAMLDRDMRYLQVSDRWCADYGVDSSQVVGRSHYELFPDIPDRWKEVHGRCLAGETVRADEDRWDRESGTKWIRWEIRPWRSHPDSLPGGILIFTEDITHRKQMEEALPTVNRKLIEAHEEERTRIARELHDDISQRLALLAVSFDVVKQALPGSATQASQQIEQTIKQIEDLGTDVQALSHRLHSSKLEHLGLERAAASFCRELSDRQNVGIEFHSWNIPRDLPQEISLTLFRVLQEALQNAIKHSGCRRFEASLSCGAGEIELTVRDSGIGFDLEEAMKGRGIGLISIRERLRLASGELSISSQLQHGTTIQARVPLTPRAKSTRAGE